MMTTAGKKRLLVVDDDAGVVDYLVEMLEEAGYVVHGATSPSAALEAVGREAFDLIILDIELPGMRGLEVMAAIHATNPEQLVLLITAFGSIDLAVRALRAGACDFITKPFQIEILLHATDRAFRERQMRREIVRLRSLLSPAESPTLITRSHAMRSVVDLARRAAQTDSTVLLTGESGVGKGQVARFIHDQSPRQHGPFIQINCAALPSPLIESELFGVCKGAYTDAREDRPGLFVQANGGTLFLDEVAEMPLESQPKLLQVLEVGQVRPVGGRTEVPVDVRILAATNRSLEDALRAHHFRADLYHRLNVIRLEIPPLRQRPEDIEVLVDLFLQRASSKCGRSIIGIATEALRWLLSYAWPGNVRELANMIERAVALTEHDTILLEDLVVTAPPVGADDGWDSALRSAAAQQRSLAEVEQAYIRHVLDFTQGNKVRAARLLAIDRKTLYQKLGASED